MTRHLGIFLNNTDSEVNYKINIINYNNLYNNFNDIIVIDLNTQYSNLLKNDIYDTCNDNKIIKYYIENSININKWNDLDYNKIIYLQENSNIYFSTYDYITFISDQYIYCNSLESYFEYCMTHDLDIIYMTDYLDKSLYNYHMYLMTLKGSYVMKFINYIIQNKDNINNNIYDIYDKKISYLKVAYLQNNDSNIFDNDLIFQYFFENNILPIISINRLTYLFDNYKYNYFKFNMIPSNFNIDIYRSHDDLKEFDDEKIYNHFINYGQYEHRRYSLTNNYVNYVLPDYLRYKLNNLNILYYFDIAESFHIYLYKTHNSDLNNMSEKDLIVHWIKHGKNENRIYF
jgi:hypothetical protein